MIEIYKSDNHNYDYNGDAVLHPSSCILSTDDWKLTIENPSDDNAPLFTREAVVTVPTWYSDRQFFRIYDYEKSESGITAYARPIFYDSAHDAFLIDVRPTDKTGQGALDIMTAGTRYTAESDITDISTAYYVRKNLIEAIMSDDDNSFLNRWGGQPVFDNYKIVINKRAGGDYGAQARFGYNLNEIQEHVNMENVATRIVPMGYNGHTLDGDKPWVDSPLIDNYEIVYTKVVKYEDVKLLEDCQDDEPGFATLEDYQRELIKRARADFKAGADLPVIEYEVDVVDLAKTSEYENIKDLVKIGYGDTVVCENESLGISTTAKVVALTWDCILQQNETVNLGDMSATYFDKISSAVESVNKAINPDGTVKGEQVGGVVDMMKTKMRATALSAKKQADKAILFEDMDPQSPTFGAMAIGTTGFMIADGRTEDDRDWNWKTFGTGKGFVADYLIAGILRSLNWEEGKEGFEINLNSGEIQAAMVKFKAIDDRGEAGQWVFQNGWMQVYAGDELVGELRPIASTDGNGSQLQIRAGDSRIGVFKNGYVQVMADKIWIGDETQGFVVDKGTINENGKSKVNGKDAKSGRIEFSDGTYQTFENGRLVGGNAKSGVF